MLTLLDLLHFQNSLVLKRKGDTEKIKQHCPTKMP